EGVQRASGSADERSESERSGADGRRSSRRDPKDRRRARRKGVSVRKTIFGNSALSTFDAIVIGSGAGGGTVAWMLAKHGKKVLVIEAGPCHLDSLDDPNKQ